jgi:hypothetical protein
MVALLEAAESMVGRQQVIASCHWRPILPLPRCHPRFGFLAALEHLDHFAGRVDAMEARRSLLLPV